MKSVIGVIGLGNMGGAIVRGLSGRDDVTLVGYDHNESRMRELAEGCGLEPAASAVEAVERADYVLVAVKPQHVKPLLKETAPALAQGGKCVLSIAAGIMTDKLRKYAGTSVPVVRIMPNTPAMVGAGVFAVCLEDENLTDGQKAFITDALGSLGQVHVLGERQFDAFTALAGSGPAYVFYFMEAVIEAGVTMGLTRTQATDMTKALFSGSCKLAEESDRHISVLREMVCSPAGTTIAATNHMDASAVRASIVEAVRKAYERSIELGK
ncbi:pyrroline-5-carboxylate reductase [Desulfobaculum xiamenense]|uniref:Pyrroline-5-carboxylate reductase n=1 Tax=Desulfobaculum xiamenense TaxID=995050 RepID=A0A846QFN6_9BACT|nr:pyrroline-5-carboxylate reductase [Desulfobaculum xiamenense]NJB67138.1 pyrroline-5-carboxylate reductase [Desulfobaculum xiamenense]